VSTEREPTAVGTAAASFTYTEAFDVPRWPSLEQSLAFIADYEAARGQPFDADERRAVHAACVYLRAYAARCGHAIGADIRGEELERLADALL
jgi:hypothetical protein